MSRRTYMQSECNICGERVSHAGVARASHNRKHVREGLLVEMYSRILDKNEFFTPEQAQKYLDATTPQENYASWVKV